MEKNNDLGLLLMAENNYGFDFSFPTEQSQMPYDNKGACDELSKDIDFIKRSIETYDTFREGFDKMLSVKISILDEDFRTMLDTMVASRGELDAAIDRLHSVQNMIGEINKTISQKLVKLSRTRDCPNRCLTK